MSNSNFSANNFSSIDAEFSINNSNSNNNINSEETMSNQQSSSDALAALSNMFTHKSTTTSIDFSDLTGLEGETFEQSTDGSAVINIVKGLPLESITIDGFSTYGNPNAKTEVTLYFNVEHRLISLDNPYSRNANRFNQRLIEVYQYVVTGFPEKVKAKFRAFDTANVADFISLVKLVHKSLKACDTVVKAQDLYGGLKGTMLMSQWEAEEQNPNQYATAAIVEQQSNVVDAQAVARLNKVIAFHRDQNGDILDKGLRTSRTLLDEQGNLSAQGTRGSAGSWVKGCLAFASTTWGFCLSDKTNTKYAYCGDAVQAIGGVSADGMKSLVVADKEGKALARHSMSAHTSAKIPGGIVSRDGLLSEMSEGRFAAHYGKDLRASYIVDSTITSLLMGDGGMVLNNPITANINKKLVANFNLTTSTLTEEEARKVVLAELQKLETLTPGQVVEYDNQVLLQYCGNIEVTVINAKFGRTIAANTEVVGLEFNLQAEATITDYNWKLRGQWLKGMTAQYNNFELLTSKGGEQLPVDLIFNANSVKNKKAMLLRMWANHTGNLIAFCKNGAIHLLKSDADGNLVEAEEINADDVQKDINKMVQDAYVSFKANPETIARHKAASPKAFETLTVSSPDADGLCTVEGAVKVINSTLVVAVELSSVAENLSVGRGVAPITTKFLTTFTDANEVVINTVRKHSDRVAKMVEASTSKEVAKVLDLHKDSLELAEVLATVVAAPSAYIAFEGLKNKFPNGLQITGNTGKKRRKDALTLNGNLALIRPWTVNLYTQLLFGNGRFNKSGWSNDTRINNVYSFLKLVAEGKRDVKTLNTIADFAYAVGMGLDMWREDVVSGKGTLTKANACLTHHGMKVIANAEAGYELHEGHQVPVILISETNPLVQTISKRKAVALDKNGRNVKPLADGSVVLFHRNPLVDLMPAIIRVVDESVVGKYVAAISPDAFALANCGDFDGDAIWLIPGTQLGIKGKGEGLTALMNHPLVGGKISNQAMSIYAGSDNILSGIVEAEDVTNLTTTEKLVVSAGVSISYELGLVADRNQQLADARISQSNPELTYSELWCQGAEATANHYRVRVGQGYSIMFNAMNTYIDLYHDNGTITDEDLIAVKAASLYIYEDLGLAGYSFGSESDFKRLYDLGKGLLGLSKATLVKTHFNGGYRAEYKQEIASSFELSRRAVLDYFAMSIIQSSINRKNSNVQRGGTLYRYAVKSAVMRSLTKGLFNSTGYVDASLSVGFVNPRDPYATLLDTVVTAARHRV